MGKKFIQIDTRQVDVLSVELKKFPIQTQNAMYHALKRSLDQTKTHVSRIVPKKYAIKQKEVKESFNGGVNYPTKSDLKASLTSKGKRLSFAHFPFTPKTPVRKGKRATVKVTIKKSNPKVISQSGFTAPTGAKSKEKVQNNVFMRLGKKRLPIAPIRTLSIPQMITSDGLENEIQEFALEKFNDRLEHELGRQTEKIQGRVKKG